MPLSVTQDVACWPDRPLLIQTGVGSSRVQANTCTACLFNTELFSGRMLLFVAGLPTSPNGLFQEQKRRTHLVIQVRSTKVVVPGLKPLPKAAAVLC